MVHLNKHTKRRSKSRVRLRPLPVRHSISNANPENRTGICNLCGPVKILNNGLNADGLMKWTCYNSSSNQRDRERPWSQSSGNTAKRARRERLLSSIHDEVCAICGAEPSTRALAIDHCHDSGKIRGLLCTRCNIGLGYFKDSIENLTKAIEYLEERG